MAAPRGSGSRRQEGGKGSAAGLSGAGFPPPPPPPLSAARRRFSGPTLPRCCPGPFHPPIKLFFFSNFLGGPGPANERRGSWDKQRRGPRAGQWERGTGWGRGLRRRDGHAREGLAGRWGRGGEGEGGVRAPAAGALSGRTAGSAGDSVRLPRRSVGCGPHVVPATSPPP